MAGGSPVRYLYVIISSPGIDVNTQARMLAARIGGLPLGQNLVPLEYRSDLPAYLKLPVIFTVYRGAFWGRIRTLLKLRRQEWPVVLVNPLMTDGDDDELVRLANYFNLKLQVISLRVKDEANRFLAAQAQPDVDYGWRRYYEQTLPQLRSRPLCRYVVEVTGDPDSSTTDMAHAVSMANFNASR